MTVDKFGSGGQLWPSVVIRQIREPADVDLLVIVGRAIRKLGGSNPFMEFVIIGTHLPLGFYGDKRFWGNDFALAVLDLVYSWPTIDVGEVGSGAVCRITASGCRGYETVLAQSIPTQVT